MFCLINLPWQSKALTAGPAGKFIMQHEYYKKFREIGSIEIYPTSQTYLDGPTTLKELTSIGRRGLPRRRRYESKQEGKLVPSASQDYMLGIMCAARRRTEGEHDLQHEGSAK
jgi:hypothetical protein